MDDVLDLLGNTADGVFGVDPEGQIIYWNQSARKILGWEAQEVLGRLCCEVLAGRDTVGNLLCYKGCHVTTMVRLGEPIQNYDMQTQDKSGHPLWLNISTLVIPGEQPDLKTTVHFFRDVTVQHQLERVVRERLAAPHPHSPAPPPPESAKLTAREREILGFLARGVNTDGLARQLGVSPATIRNHIQNIMGKLEVHSRLEAVAYAHRHGLLS